MYIPGAFRIDDQELIREIVRENPFAMLVTVKDGEPFATHLPVILTDGDVLVGHMARANPQWMGFTGNCMAVFAGPHGYVSPSWYENRPNVPTWNYVAVHAYGRAELVVGEDAIAHLQELVQTFDPNLASTHPESTDPDLIRKKLAGIVAFRIKVERWEAKAKLSQNKPEADRLAVRKRFSTSDRAQDRALADLML